MKFGDNPYKGPYEVVTINNNGTLRLKSLLGQRAVYEVFNIRNIHPCE